MGQYHYVVNVDKRQFLHPHDFDDGLKLLEFGTGGEGTMAALALLLARDSGRGGGDAKSGSLLIGSWAGDRVEIAGDYGDERSWSELSDEHRALLRESNGGNLPNLHNACNSPLFENISLRMRDVLIAEGCP